MASKVQAVSYRFFGYQSLQSPKAKVVYLDQFITYFVLMFIVGMGVSAWLGFSVFGFNKTNGALFHLKAWGAIAVHSIMDNWFVDITERYSAYLDLVESKGYSTSYYGRLLVSITASLSFAYWVARGELTPINRMQHSRGRELFKGKEAISQLVAKSKSEIAISSPDFKLHPELVLSRDRWTKHMFFLGAVGGGKTQSILPILLQIFQNNDKAVIFDIKGDFTAMFGNAILVAPWDKRGVVWNIAKDVRTKSDARELASRLIEESKDPMWSNAARQVFTGMIVSLQNNRGTKWGWGDLAKLLAIKDDKLIPLMEEHNPEGLRAVDGAETTTSGIMINLSAFMNPIFDMAKAWSDKNEIEERIEAEYEDLLDKKIKDEIKKQKEEKNKDRTYDEARKAILANSKIVDKLKKIAEANINFSFIDWLFDETKSGKQQIILQGNGRYDSMAKGVHGAILSLLSSRINSPEIGESKTRRLWFVLDEFPQLGKVSAIEPLIALGRSKDVRVVLGAQDLGQIKKTYSVEEANAWMAMIGTQVFVKVSAGETADWVSELIGDQEVMIQDVSATMSNQGVQNNSQSMSFKRETIPVLMPDQLSSELGVEQGGVRVLVLGFDDAYIIKLPFTTLPNERLPSVMAKWTEANTSQDEEAYILQRQDEIIRLHKAKKLQKQLEAEKAEKDKSKKEELEKVEGKTANTITKTIGFLGEKEITKSDKDASRVKAVKVDEDALENYHSESNSRSAIKTSTYRNADYEAMVGDDDPINRGTSKQDKLNDNESQRVSIANRNNAINDEINTKNNNYVQHEEADDGFEMVADKAGTSFLSEMIGSAVGSHEIGMLIEVAKEMGDMYDQNKVTPKENPRNAANNRAKIVSEYELEKQKEIENGEGNVESKDNGIKLRRY